MLTSSTIREIRHFHVVVVQWRQSNVQKSVMHVQSCCSYCYFCRSWSLAGSIRVSEFSERKVHIFFTHRVLPKARAHLGLWKKKYLQGHPGNRKSRNIEFSSVVEDLFIYRHGKLVHLSIPVPSPGNGIPYKVSKSLELQFRLVIFFF